MADSQRLVPLIRRLATGAIGAMVVLALTLTILTGLAWRSAAWVDHTHLVQETVARAINLARERQLSINRYLITGDTATLALERDARPALVRTMDSLSRLVADNRKQEDQLRVISSSIETWDSTYVEPALRVSDARSRERFAESRRAGTMAFSSVIREFEKMQQREEALLVERAQRRTIWGWTQLIVVALEALFVLYVLIQMRRELLEHAARVFAQQSLLKEQAARLEEQADKQRAITEDLAVANHELTDAALHQQTLTADLEITNQELTEATMQAEDARDSSRALEKQYRLLFDRNPVPMWVYDQETLRFLAVNTAAIEQYGYSTAEFLAMSLEDIRTPEDAELSEPGDPIPGRLYRSPGWRHRRKDGSVIQVDVVSHTVGFEGRGARLVLALDVTARKSAELALSESNAILRAVIDDSPLPIIILLPDLTISRWNDAAVIQFGWKAEDAIGASLYAIIPDNKRDELVGLRDRLEAGETIANFETQRMRLDGTVRDVLLSQGALRDDEGVLTGYVGIYSDVTDRKRLEMQFRQAQKMEAVGQLAGGVAHDFNNLLTVIISYSQMLSSELREGSAELADVREIKRSAERAALLTKQLLAFSRQQVLQPHILDLNLVIENLELMLRRLLREDIEIVMTLDPLLGAVAADPGQIEQIVMNLVVNARDAMPNGGIVAIETSNVVFECAYQLRANEPSVEAGAYVMIAVRDNGVGMSRDVQSRIFEPFYTTKPAHQGTGLGLSTVYGIVKQSGGHLTLYSEPGHGTIFKIYLPRVDAAPEVLALDEGLLDAALCVGGETILIVEDDEALRTVASRSLQERGYTVLEAANGLAALATCTERGAEIDLVVTDMVMPEMSGAELAERIAILYPDIRVLLMSGYTRDEAARRGIASERYSFLEKPFTPARLASRVRDVLDGRRALGGMLLPT